MAAGRRDFVGLGIVIVADHAASGPMAANTATVGEAANQHVEAPVETRSGALAERVQQRWSDGTFPLVSPEELQEPDVGSAVHTLKLLKGAAPVGLSAFLAEKWAQHMDTQSSSVDGAAGDGMAKWAVASYWPLCREWMIRGSLRDKTLPHFFNGGNCVPVFPEAGPGADDGSGAEACGLEDVQEADVAHMELSFWAGWQDFGASSARWATTRRKGSQSISHRSIGPPCAAGPSEAVCMRPPRPVQRFAAS